MGTIKKIKLLVTDFIRLESENRHFHRFQNQIVNPYLS